LELSAVEATTADGYDLIRLPGARLPLNPAPPVIQAGLEFGPAGAAFGILAEEGLEYDVEVSTDLRQWTPLQIVIGTGQVLRFEDPDRYPARFYRVRER
jgi:hypothetical protein